MTNSIKRGIDVVFGTLALIVLSPVLAAAAIIVRMMMGRPVLFRHTRPGRHGRPFTMYKFRTMRNARDADGRQLPDAVRLTAVGRFFRSMSVDELPQLWNVIRGDMSLVGPRALLMEYLPLYTTEQRRRHAVRPGITGWAQVCGRNRLSWEEKFELDLWYVDNRTTLIDLRILVLTLVRVAARDGITQREHATVEPFRGITS